MGGTEEPTPVNAQTEPAEATTGVTELAAGFEGENSPPNATGGGGYILQKARGSGPTATGVILFIAGLLAIGAAAAIYATRKERV